MRMAAITTVLFVLLAGWFVVRMLGLFRRRGYITRFS
jgi:hypothetical protein